MSDFISDIDTAKLYVQFLRPLSQCVVSWKCWLIWIRFWVVAYESKKNKEKSNLVTPKVVAVAYESGRKESSTTFRFVILLPFSRSCDGFIFILRRFMWRCLRVCSLDPLFLLTYMLRSSEKIMWYSMGNKPYYEKKGILFLSIINLTCMA